MQDSEPNPWSAPLALGKVLRFAVVEPGSERRSSVWRVWTGKSTDDVYFCESITGGDFKASHHNRWKWRIAMTKERALADGSDRAVIVEWRDDSTDGWSEGAGLLVPVPFLRASVVPLKKSVRRIPTSGLRNCVRVRLLFQEAGAAPREFGPGVPVGVLDRPGGGRVYVIADHIDVSPRTLAECAVASATARSQRSVDEEFPTDRFVWVVQLGGQPVHVDLTIAED